MYTSSTWKNPILIIICIILTILCPKDSLAYVDKTLSHPRILLLDSEKPNLKALIKTDSVIERVNNYIIKESNDILNKPLLQYHLVGLRLLVAREALMRIFYLSYSYRMTEDSIYANRAIQEMVNVCKFNDWNPSHFLDIAEMTMGIAIGYDWLYQLIDNRSKNYIVKKVQELAFAPAFNSKYASFYNNTNNWNSVCNAGLLYGAIAFENELPKLAEAIIAKCIATNPKALDAYKPNGVYPEGYAYWSYGTTSQVLLIDALEYALGSDFGLSTKKGFLESAYFIQHMATPLGKNFNFSDSTDELSTNIAMWWFAYKTRDTSLLYLENKLLNNKNLMIGELRLLPVLPILAARLGECKVDNPKSNYWFGTGINPVFLYRSGWENKTDTYLGIKGGSASVSHAHMDAGSFIYEFDGVRWAMDLGMQNYNSLESKGVGVWKNGQDGQRWEILRMRNEYHNTLTFDKARHNVSAKAEIVDTFTSLKHKGAIIDLTSTLGKAKRVQREVSLNENDHLTVIDHIETGDSIVNVMWVMVTPADAEIYEDGTINLSKDGKRMVLSFKSPISLTPKIWSTTPIHAYDIANTGTVRVGYEVEIPKKQNISIEVTLTPITPM